MSNLKSELLSSMNGKTVTLGWDAIVSYNRDRINNLLAQQFAKKSAEGDGLVVPDQEIPPSHSSSMASTYLNVSSLALGQPLLSFTNANLDDSSAALAMQFLSGYFFSISAPVGPPSTISQYNSVLPDSNYNLTMTLPLKQTTGEISDSGDIYLDLSAAEASDISVNLVDDASTQQALSTYFQDMFAAASNDRKRYDLGTMKNIDDGNPLNPKRFELRTQAAPNTSTDTTDPSYGDGAVVLFVQTAASDTGGSLPTSTQGFPYLIPDDVDNSGVALFSGSVIVGSRTLFGKIIQPAYLSQIDSPDASLAISLLDNGEANPASYLKATAGHISGGTLNLSWNFTEEQPAPAPSAYVTVSVSSIDENKNVSPISLPITGLEITPSMQSVNGTWPAKYDQYIYQLWEQTSPSDFKTPTYQSLHISYTGSSTSTPSVTPGNNVVTFSNDSSSTSITLGDFPWSKEINDDAHKDQISSNLAGDTLAAINKIASLNVPDIDTFTLGNVLFPQQNTLQLSDVSIPGDMALFGQLDPSTSACLLTPIQTTLVARNPAQSTLVNDTQTFTLSGPAELADAVIEWSISNSDGIYTDDRIESSGTLTAVYQAPDISLLDTTSMQEIVTATATVTRDDGSSTTYTASAVVIVSANPVNISPRFVYAVYDPGNADSNTPITFTASVVNKSADDTGSPTWSDGMSNAKTLATGVYAADYTPNLATGVYGLEQVTFSMGPVSVMANVLVVKSGLYATLYVGAGDWQAGDDPNSVVAGNLTPLQPGASRQLAALQINQMTGDATNVAGSYPTAWQILGAPVPDDGSLGTLSASGLYTAPETVTTTCVTIMFIDPMGDFGYTVIPLLPGVAAA